MKAFYILTIIVQLFAAIACSIKGEYMYACIFSIGMAGTSTQIEVLNLKRRLGVS